MSFRACSRVPNNRLEATPSSAFVSRLGPIRHPHGREGHTVHSRTVSQVPQQPRLGSQDTEGCQETPDKDRVAYVSSRCVRNPLSPPPWMVGQTAKSSLVSIPAVAERGSRVPLSHKVIYR